MRSELRWRAVFWQGRILTALAVGIITFCGVAQAKKPKKVDLAICGEKQILVEALPADSNRLQMNALEINNVDVVLLVDDRGTTTRIDKATTVEQLQEALKGAKQARIELENPSMQQMLVEFIYPTYLKYSGAKTKGKEGSLDRVVIRIPGGLTFLIRAE
jgi:hypothetical protein